MKLTQLFSGETRSESAGRVQMTPAQAENLNRQVRSLTPGQTISGEIISKNGNEVQIRLSDDMVLNARVDRSLNIEIGKNMTFEVKNNGSALTLSPLFTNVSTDINVLKALDMAGLPVNETSVGMTEQLMAAGLPVNKNILQQIYREVNSFPQGEISDVIQLHKLQMPVNEANMNQMASYRNLTHQLIGGMDAILEALPEVFRSMAAEGDVSGAIKLYQDIFLLAQENGGGSPAALTGAFPGSEALGQVILQEAEPGSEALGQEVLQEAELGKEALGQGAVEGSGQLDVSRTQAIAEKALKEVIRDIAPRNEGETAMLQAAGGKQDSLPQALREAVAGEALNLLDNLSLPFKEASEIRAQIMRFAQGQSETGQFFSALGLLAEAGERSGHSLEGFERLFSGKAFKDLLEGQLKDNWMIRPKELAVLGKVEELYRRLDRQLKALSGALENAGQNETPAFRATSSMSQNIDFLQQINQMYSYVQLPLKMQQGEAHGELYVYANRKNLAGRDGKISALLHLDMEHLGPVDVYVTLQNSQVNTRFYLRDEEMIDFISEHMDILTKRLQQRGYDCSFAMTIRGEGAGEATEGGLNPILGQERGVMLSQYAFDVRT